MSEACLKQRYGFTTLYRERGGILYALFQIRIIFCHWLLEIKKKKERGGSLHAHSNNSNLLQGVWLCYARLCDEDNERKRRQNDGKTSAIMVLSYSYLAPVKKCYYKFTVTDVAVWLSCYGYIFAILMYFTTINPCLKIFFF